RGHAPAGANDSCSSIDKSILRRAAARRTPPPRPRPQGAGEYGGAISRYGVVGSTENLFSRLSRPTRVGGESVIQMGTDSFVPVLRKSLQDEFAEVGVLGEGRDAFLHVLGVDGDGGAGAVGGGEADVLEQALHDRVEAAGADVLDRGIDLS